MNTVWPLTTHDSIDLRPLIGRTFTIGCIVPDTTSIETEKPYHEQIIASSLNDYTKLLGYDVSFEYLVYNAEGDINEHLEAVQGFKSMDVTIFEGGGWSSQAKRALEYINANGMLMWSTSSSPALAIADDNLFRISSSNQIVLALVDVMWAAGVRSIVIFQRGDSWGDDMVDQLAQLWIAKGGEISGAKVRYDADVADFASYLSVADQEVKDAVGKQGGDSRKVAVIMIANDEITPILENVSGFENMYNVHWWWLSGDSKSEIHKAVGGAINAARHIGVFTLTPFNRTPLYDQLADEYEGLTRQRFSPSQAYSYDIALVLMNSILEAQSVSGVDLIPLQKPLCDHMFGSTGFLHLDEFGDRDRPSFDIWGYVQNDAADRAARMMVGTYNADAEAVHKGEGTTFFPSGIYTSSPTP